MSGARPEPGNRGTATNDEAGARRAPALPRNPSLARLLHEYSDRWEIERVERNTEWVAVLRDTGGDYIRIVGAHDLGALRYKMDEVERDEPQERTNGAP
jgi:hypothetical protein